MTALTARNGASHVGTAVRRLPALALLWWVLAEGSLYGLPLALTAIAAAATASVALAPRPAGLRLARIPGFIPFFVWQSVRGGVDVALRAVRPTLAVAPGFHEHRFGIPDGAPRMMMTALVSLFPGTLSAAMDGDVLRVHVLDRAMDVRASLAEMEARVQRLFE